MIFWQVHVNERNPKVENKNEKLLKILDGLRAELWNNFRIENTPKNIQIDHKYFSNKDFSNIDFSGVRLQDICFFNCN